MKVFKPLNADDVKRPEVQTEPEKQDVFCKFFCFSETFKNVDLETKTDYAKFSDSLKMLNCENFNDGENDFEDVKYWKLIICPFLRYMLFYPNHRS